MKRLIIALIVMISFSLYTDTLVLIPLTVSILIISYLLSRINVEPYKTIKQ